MVGPMRYFWLPIFVILAACTGAWTEPRVIAEQCMKEQFLPGTKVSADLAREALANCEGILRKWLDASMTRTCRGPCNYSQPQVVNERRARRHAMENILMISISDEVEPVPRM
jgi:hypothetical protein